MGLPGIRANHQEEIGVLDILGGMSRLIAEQFAIDPEAAGLLLCQSRVNLTRFHGNAQRSAVRSAEMVPLSASAVVGSRGASAARRAVNT
jgi:hypothetical protein